MATTTDPQPVIVALSSPAAATLMAPRPAAARRPHVSTATVRAFHNWVKRQLYATYLHPRGFLVEVGCGRGGDLLKAFRQSPGRWLNIDIDQSSIDKGKTRALEQAGATGHELYQKITWVCGDLTDAKTLEKLILDGHLTCPGSVNVFSSQFSLTYFWRTRAIFDQTLDWIATFLKPGGHFIGNVPDGQRMESLCHVVSTDDEQKKSGRTRMFASDMMSFSIDEFPSDGEVAPFGRRVVFEMSDSVVNVPTPEYYVHWPTFVDMASQHGLGLVKSETFDEAYKNYSYSNLGSLEMQTSFINRSFVFQKRK